jgi:NitT/TauT family transport system permease protein
MAQPLDAELVRQPVLGRPYADVLDEEPRAGRFESLKLPVARLIFLAAFLLLWQLASGTLIAEFWIGKPSTIMARLVQWTSSGYLLFHLGITLQEMAWGFLFGASAGVISGFVLGSNPFFGKLADPFITAIYSLPKIALAPLFVLWFGIGLEMKIVLTATIVFFLVFWNTYAGVREADPELIGVLRVMGAKRRHIITKVVLPGAMSWIYIGLKLAIPYALIGAIVGELIASNRGLGFVLQYSAGQFDTAGLFAGLIVLMLISTILNEVLNRSEGYVLRWKTVGR